MAAASERANFIERPSSEGAKAGEGEEDFFASSGGCWDLLCCFGSRRESGYSDEKSLLQGEPQGEAWWLRKARSVKEFSEVVAGPKWKTFLRRFSNGFKRRRSQFQYDPQSYALNFVDDEEERECPSFSTRFAAPSGKYSAPLVHQ
ncbi:hypothetical protein H6P81_000729 [Aristolochia fimbriata]|uniref:Uncharacterized protein n=1 Tax=Aristolochia fimbriata TaxID=158543 RepID=A0AAV7F826_ARIFI|nr:hypothetical protein H6P81_000729 [Aristolochia fimbriata]